MVIDRQTSILSVDTTVTETSFWSFSVDLTGNLILRARLAFDSSNTTGATRDFTLRLKIGSTTWYNDNFGSVLNGQTFRPGFIELLIGDRGGDQFELAYFDEAGQITVPVVGQGDLTTTGGHRVQPLAASAVTVEGYPATIDFTIQPSFSSGLLAFRRQWAYAEVF